MLTAVAATYAGHRDNSDAPQATFVGTVLVIAFSLATTFATGYISFLNPVQRWQQLRAAQLELESHAWMFRTRTGDYCTTRSSSRAAERELHATVFRVRASIIEVWVCVGTRACSRCHDCCVVIARSESCACWIGRGDRRDRLFQQPAVVPPQGRVSPRSAAGTGGALV